MQAVILAGGRGRRLGPLTERVPKPMALVAGVPYLEYQLRLLGRQHITDVVLLTGYLGERIEEYFADGHRWNLSIRYSREKVAVGTGGALRDARSLLAGKFLVVYGDSFLPIDYRKVLETLEASKSAAAVAVYDNWGGPLG